MAIVNNSIKYKEKQRVTLSPLLSLLALAISLLMIFYPFFKDQVQEKNRSTKAKLESLAFQVAVFEGKKIALNQNSINKGRSPAAFNAVEKLIYGSIGLDESGRPMNYEVQKLGNQMKVSVWISGNLNTKTEVLIPLDK